MIYPPVLTLDPITFRIGIQPAIQGCPQGVAVGMSLKFRLSGQPARRSLRIAWLNFQAPPYDVT